MCIETDIKVVKKRNLGLMARYKIVAQVLITGAYLSSLYLNGTLSTIVTLPLLGAVDFGWFFYVLSFLLIIGMVNAVNLTDGIDAVSYTHLDVYKRQVLSPPFFLCRAVRAGKAGDNSFYARVRPFARLARAL